MLTPRQREVQLFIESCWHEGYLPTIREICDYFDFASPQAAQRHLEALRNKGYLGKRPGGQIQLLTMVNPTYINEQLVN